MPLPEMPQLAGVTHRDVIVRGLRMHIAEAGPADAPTLLLAHGWPQHWFCWNRVVPDLSRDHRLLMPDLRGFGWTESTSGGYEKESLADDLIGLLDELGLDRVTYVGHDWGGFIGFLFAMKAPERLDSLLSLSIPHPWPPKAQTRDPRRVAVLAYQVPITLPGVSTLVMKGGMCRRILERAATRGTFTDSEIGVYDRFYRTGKGVATTKAMYRTFITRELRPMMRGRYRDSRLEVRTHLAVGALDPIMEHGSLDGFERNAPQMTVESVEGARHFLPEERPDVVISRVRELTGRDAEGPRIGEPSGPPVT